jgi:transcriptional regulator with XRE-family HTH domain
MSTTAMPERPIHHGRNLRRIREILEIKQDALATLLGDEWNQQKVSYLEQKQEIDAPLLEEVAKALKVPVDAIKNFNEEAAIFNIQNNYDGSNANATNVGPANYMNYQCTFNPIEKLVEVIEENKKLYAALLKEKDEKIALLEKLVKEKK